MKHLPALDGLRGVAVIGVLAFHLDHLRGGFLGVDLFFVLSGFLITSLLLVEWRDAARIDLGAFWARRARRLLPALFLLLAAVAAYAATRPTGVALEPLRADALATIGYVANWHAILAHHGYWELFAAPSLLAHTWSLAIEEQLYVLWPLVVYLALRLSRGRLPVLLATALGLAAASSIAMIVLHRAGGDTTRVYFGTDTRAAPALFGAAVAIYLAWRGPVRGAVLSVAGVVAGAGLAVAWFRVSGTADRLYGGGFALCGIAAATVIASITQPGGGPLSRPLSFAPLRHLGAISYGVYLWHWPVFVVMSSSRPVRGWALLVAKLVVTLAISEASYRVLELHIRRGSLRGWRIRIAAPVAAVAAIVAVIAGTAVPAPASVVLRQSKPASPADLATGRAHRLLVVGDSGAAFLGEGLVRQGPAVGVQVRNAGEIACGLVTAGGKIKLAENKYLDDPPDCAQRADRWRDELASFRPDVVLLVIAWPGLGDRLVAGAWRHPCDAAFDAYYASELRHALRLLAQTGAHVVIADSPYLTLPVTQPDASDRVDCLNVIYRREAANAGVSVLPVREWLCNAARTCTIDEGGVTLRFDGVHFRDRGADIAARWALPQLSADAESRSGPNP